eukprot:CAMPEP_0205896038 /NCGR_PEP_ID=MMETSP1083-20121108/24735_1 /ASSEMBLY_ACC=CAM_ASM_000430 /TAXON_ID=97485 /ORGANISM="Prymnesium parvum, Strain Texoma1" /LENGTH=133 /DNA_ID=CAMNT_0053261073 /DNA_START=350 /DNA_END=747 /DNA_ORIENTATION=+
MKEVVCDQHDVKQFLDALLQKPPPHLVVPPIRVGDERESVGCGESDDRREQLPPRPGVLEDIEAIGGKDDIDRRLDAHAAQLPDDVRAVSPQQRVDERLRRRRTGCSSRHCAAFARVIRSTSALPSVLTTHLA